MKLAERPRILLYSPDVIGHPAVYCRVIADSLRRTHCDLLIGAGFTEKFGLRDAADLQPLTNRPGVTILDTRSFSGEGKPHLTAEELVALQQRFKIATTLFIEADKSEWELRRAASGHAPRLRGKNIGIFANTCEWYPGEDRFTGRRHSLVASTLKTTLGNVKRKIVNKKDTTRYFFEKTVIASGVLNEVWSKDERLSEWHGPPVYWMPELSRPQAAEETVAEKAHFARRQVELATFLSKNAGREPVLYFGDAAHYKGYDLFLQLIASAPATCAVHPGRSYDDQQRSLFSSDVDALRNQLKREGRLLETNEYVHTQALKELYFGCVRVYLTTHRLSLSSSTVIQAIELGKPVLVPDRGLLGHRVRTNRIGHVYRYGDVEDLRRKAEGMWRSDLSGYVEAAHEMWTRFSDDSIQRFLRTRLGAIAEDARCEPGVEHIGELSEA